MPDNDLDDQAQDAIKTLKKIIEEMETEEGLKRLKDGEFKFEIKRDPGVLWYVAYGT